MSRPLIDYARAGLRLDDVPVIDIHAHLGRAWSEINSLEVQLAEMDRLGIDRVVVSSVAAIAGDIVRGNDEVLDAVRAYPGRVYGYIHVSANFPELIMPELERGFAVDGVCGIKLYQVGPRYDDPLFEPVYAFAAARKAPVLAHTWGGSLTGFDVAAEKHPEIIFLAGHAGSGFAYQPYVDVAKRLPNFYLDLTYSREHTNMIEYFIEHVPAEQIVWGSDVPTFSMSQQLAKLLFARIPDATKRQILYDNPARVLGIQVCV